MRDVGEKPLETGKIGQKRLGIAKNTGNQLTRFCQKTRPARFLGREF